MKEVHPQKLSPTEAHQQRFQTFHAWSSEEMLRALLEGQSTAIQATELAVGQISRAVEGAFHQLKTGQGRLIYCGAGTSGRLAVLDGTELDPTFGWPRERLAFALAGGVEAMTRSVENAEDDQEAARARMEALALNRNDVVISLAASGNTAYALQCLEMAGSEGAMTIALVNNPNGKMVEAARIAIVLNTGPEVLAGSTRMAAGTAQKIALNLFSTSLMAKLGYVYQGLMVEMRPTNAKLRERAVRIVCSIAMVGENEALKSLERCNMHIPTAILIACGLKSQAAKDLYARHKRLDKCLAEIAR